MPRPSISPNSAEFSRVDSGSFGPRGEGRSMTDVWMTAKAGTYFQREKALPERREQRRELRSKDQKKGKSM